MLKFLSISSLTKTWCYCYRWKSKSQKEIDNTTCDRIIFTFYTNWEQRFSDFLENAGFTLNNNTHLDETMNKKIGLLDMGYLYKCNFSKARESKENSIGETNGWIERELLDIKMEQTAVQLY